MTPDMRQGGAPDAAPSTISPHQATDPVEDNATAPAAEGIDLDEVLDAVFAGNTRRRQRAELLWLEDIPDHGLFYGRRVNWLSGAMGGCKTWVAAVVGAAVLLEGGHVGYIDCESDAAEIVGRLRELGVPRDVIAAGFSYHRPHSRTEWHHAVGTLMRRGAPEAEDLELDVIVVDGVTAAFDLTGTNGNDAVEVKAWVRKGPAALARVTGAGVVCIDHLPRAGGDAPAGSFHKHDTVDGVAYVLEAERRFTPGRRGVLALRNVKDRPGAIDAFAPRGSVVGRIVLDATADDGAIQWTAVHDVASAGPSAAESAERLAPRVTAPAERREDLLEAVSRALEASDEPLSGNAVKKAVSGAGANVLRALALLVDEGHVAREEVPGRGRAKATHRHRLLTPYPGPSPAPVSSPPLRGVGGRTTQGVPAAQTQGQTHLDTPQTHQTQGVSQDHDTPQTHPPRQTQSLAVVR